MRVRLWNFKCAQPPLNCTRVHTFYVLSLRVRFFMRNTGALSQVYVYYTYIRRGFRTLVQPSARMRSECACVCLSVSLICDPRLQGGQTAIPTASVLRGHCFKCCKDRSLFAYREEVRLPAYNYTRARTFHAKSVRVYTLRGCVYS